MDGGGGRPAFQREVVALEPGSRVASVGETIGMLKTLLCAVALAGAATPSLAENAALRDDLGRRTIERRAVEAVIWGMPAVNYDLMLQQMLEKTGGKVNQIVYWGRPLDWHNQTLTPNPDALYFMAFYDTKDVGPVAVSYTHLTLPTILRV